MTKKLNRAEKNLQDDLDSIINELNDIKDRLDYHTNICIDHKRASVICRTGIETTIENCEGLKI